MVIVNIDVPDLELAKEFYLAAFDLRLGRKLGSEAVELLGDTLPIYLLLKHEGSKISDHFDQQRSYIRHWSPIHLDFVVNDIDSAIVKAIDAGAVLEQSIATSTWGKSAVLSDPFGHGFCLLQFLNNGYDELSI